MRLFTALELPTAVRDDLAAAAGGRTPIPPARWHLTLAFYGELDEVRVAPLAARLERAARRSRPLSLHLAGSGVFGRGPRAVLWCGVRGDLDGLAALARSAAAAGRREGVPAERRRYRPHVTLGRLDERGARELAASLAGYTGPAWTARELVLVQSRLGPEVVHQVVAGFALRERDEPGRGW